MTLPVDGVAKRARDRGPQGAHQTLPFLRAETIVIRERSTRTNCAPTSQRTAAHAPGTGGENASLPGTTARTL
jgi:hypothetical protein